MGKQSSGKLTIAEGCLPQFSISIGGRRYVLEKRREGPGQHVTKGWVPLKPLFIKKDTNAYWVAIAAAKAAYAKHEPGEGPPETGGSTPQPRQKKLRDLADYAPFAAGLEKGDPHDDE